ncbi:uncharacterized protein LOC133300893 isoform X2 [Gastrolobium bilobum]|uniref:uncharacterized protein LOC133300893 isoform X2 n=1 Tax=Gastrolobium bilobum TaxID=150636 RepID=UPI002AB111D2|nr:uncharacterized protein LOC133300893 isoform X2 [Gastrolobium bilobum]
MAENLDDGEFWLPPQFLADEDMTATPFKPKDSPWNRNNCDDAVLFPSEFPYSSNLSSPVESLGGGSSETESDEEEQLVAELTRRVARSTLQTDFKTSDNSMGRFVTGSPQSTLCAFGSGCGCRKGSSEGSPNGVCKLCSARATWDLLHAAVGEVERMRLNQEAYGFNHHNHNRLLVPQRKPSPVTLPSNNNTTTNLDVGFYNTQQSLSHQQLQIAQFQMLRQQQMEKQQNSVWGVQKLGGDVYQQRQNNQMVSNRGRNIDGGGRNTRPLGLSQSAWPPLQHAKQQNQQYGSGMRAVFLGNPSGRRECAGTGVFLPRRIDSPAESRKKPACSTVLVPARVAQALNLKLDDRVGGHPQHLHRFNVSSNMENVAAVPRHRSNDVFSEQKRNLRPQPTVNHEIRLPQEWTY